MTIHAFSLGRTCLHISLSGVSFSVVQDRPNKKGPRVDAQNSFKSVVFASPERNWRAILLLHSYHP